MANKELLRQTLAYIEEHPDEWDQRDWHCGTTCCFAGHAALLAGAEWANDIPHTLMVRPPGGGREMRVQEFAEDALGLEHTQAEALFYEKNTIEDLRLLVRDFTS